MSGGDAMTDAQEPARMPHGLFNLIDHVAKCLVLMREELMKERGREGNAALERLPTKWREKGDEFLRNGISGGQYYDCAQDLEAALRGASPHPPDQKPTHGLPLPPGPKD